MVCKLMKLMRKPLDGFTLLYICLHDHHYVLDFFLFYGDITEYYGPLWTTYDRGRIWGDFIFTPRGCKGDDSLGIVVGVSTCCCPCQTYPGQHQCELNIYYFFGFSYYKNLYVLCSQIYTCIQCNTKTLVVSDLVLARRDSENVFDRPLVLKIKQIPQTIFHEF